MFNKYLITALLIFPSIAQADLTEELFEGAKRIEELHQFRQSLSATIPMNRKADIETFKTVCKPVGDKAKKLNLENPWQMHQVSHKPRNPANKANLMEIKAIGKMQRDHKLESLVMKTDKGQYYFRKISVKASCLACHGSKSERPPFVKQKYPQDKAYGFSVGDVRGVYSLFLPNLKKN